jgi:hypothetical protein
MGRPRLVVQTNIANANANARTIETTRLRNDVTIPTTPPLSAESSRRIIASRIGPVGQGRDTKADIALAVDRRGAAGSPNSAGVYAS